MTRALILVLTLLLSACGLHPLYSGGSSGAVASGLSRVMIGPIPDRAGYLMRGALQQRISPAGNPAYRLDVELDDDITGFGIRGDSSTTRERRTLRARYQLVEIATGQVVLDATAGSDVGIDITSSEYSTVAAEQTALERLSTILADQMVTRLGLYFARQQ